jgi:hypothetical protein
MIERLPTRGQWEMERAVTTAGPPKEATPPTEVAEALASIRTWYVPLNGVTSTQDPTVVERLKVSVQDNMADALEAIGHQGSPIDINVSIPDEKSVHFSAATAMPGKKAIELRFAASIQRARGQAQVQPVGSISLIGGDGQVIRLLGADEIAASCRETKDNESFLIGAYIAAVLLPVVGLGIAVYTAAAERRAAIRRHAIAIAGVSILAAGAYVLIITSIK